MKKTMFEQILHKMLHDSKGKKKTNSTVLKRLPRTKMAHCLRESRNNLLRQKISFPSQITQ